MNENTVFNLSLPLGTINYILNVLTEKPFKEVATLVDNVQKQCQEQVSSLKHTEETEIVDTSATNND